MTQWMPSNKPIDFWKRDSKSNKNNTCDLEQPCLIQKFFENQKRLPPAMRSKGAMICCRCKRCNPFTL